MIEKRKHQESKDKETDSVRYVKIETLRDT